MRYIRVFAEPAAGEPDTLPFCVDAIVGDDNRILGRHALFGVLGSFDFRDVQFEPFLLDHDGKVDWGSGFDDIPNERFGTVDFRDGPVTVGRLLTFQTTNYGAQHYRIARIFELPAKR